MFKSEHKFITEKQQRRGNILRFVCAFLAFALVFGSISAAVILKHNDISLKEVFGKEEETTDIEETKNNLVELPKEIGGETNYLLYSANIDASEIYFMALVNADMDDKIFKVRALDTSEPAYLSELKTGGCKALVSAVEKKENLKIEKYVGSTADTFALAINYMGGLEYSIGERIEYRTDDYTLILTKGEQTIKGETLLKFFRYAKTLGDEGLELQSRLICKMFDSYINSDNLEKGLTIYQKLLSKLNTNSDISYIEAADMIDTLKVYCKSEEKQPAEVVTLPKEEEQ